MALPEKKYFSIEEIAIRWKCGLDSIFQYFEMRILFPSIKYKGLEGQLWEGDMPGNEVSSKLLTDDYKLDNTIVYVWDYNNLNRTYFDEQPVIELTNTILVFNVQSPNKWIRVKPKTVGGFLIDEDNFIITKEERDRFEKEYSIDVENIKNKIITTPKFEYVNNKRLDELESIISSNFDLKRLICLCNELNSNYSNDNYHSVAMLLRAILDHIPPIFNVKNFAGVYNNYSGSKSFKEMMEHLDKQLRKIADSYLHTHIGKKEILPNDTQVNFSQALDVLLGEVYKILSQKT